MRWGEHGVDSVRRGQGGGAPLVAAQPAGTDRGRPLDAATAGRMGAALGHSFASVRIHDDPTAGEAVRREGAIATTVGTDISFAPGAYRPGTLAGDALLAHELAHVQQQRGAATTDLAPPGDSRALEEDAAQATVGALARLHGVDGLAAGRGATRTGPLAVQRCAASWAPAMPPGSTTAPASAAAGMLTGERVDQLLSQSTVVGPYIRPKMTSCTGSRRATGHVLFYEAAQFGDAQLNYLSRVRHPQHPGACGRNYTESEAHAESPYHGFEDSGTIRVNAALAKAATPLHEGLHLFQDDAVADELGLDVMEGMTEYFTREVLAEFEPGLLPQRANHYPQQYHAIERLVTAGGISKATIARAYFNGDLAALRTAIDAGHPGRYQQWRGFMRQVPPDYTAANALF